MVKRFPLDHSDHHIALSGGPSEVLVDHLNFEPCQGIDDDEDDKKVMSVACRIRQFLLNKMPTYHLKTTATIAHLSVKPEK